MSTVMFTPDGIYFARAPTQMLVQRAFGIAEDRVLGLPAWAKSDSYIIQARVDNSDLARWRDLPSDQRRIALIRLLTTRFGLKFRPPYGLRVQFLFRAFFALCFLGTLSRFLHELHAHPLAKGDIGPTIAIAVIMCAVVTLMSVLGLSMIDRRNGKTDIRVE